jgi:hypothetical protein
LVFILSQQIPLWLLVFLLALLMVPEQVWDWHCGSYRCVFFIFCFVFCLPLFGSFCGFLRKC